MLDFFIKILIKFCNLLNIFGQLMFIIIPVLIILFSIWIKKESKKTKEIFEKGKLREGIVIAYEDYETIHYDNTEDGIDIDGYRNYYVTAIIETLNDFNEKEIVKISDWRYSNDKEILFSALLPINTKVQFYEYNGKYKFAQSKEYYEKNNWR